MTTARDPIDALQDILRNMALAHEFCLLIQTVDELEADPKTLYSITRALEIVGEATKRVPDSVRALELTVPWREMAGMRDKLIHAYEEVDVEIVMKTVREDIPVIAPRIEALLQRIS